MTDMPETRAEARAIGAKRYRGRPCPRGHTAGRFTSCKQCCVCTAERTKDFYKKNAGRGNFYLQRWRKANPDKVALQRKRRKRDKEKAAKNWKEWSAANKDKLSRRMTPYFRERLKVDVNFRISVSLRKYIGSVVKNGRKGGSAVRDLGCTIEEFRAYMEAKFEPGMSWNNWGSVWEIDHIEPLSSFHAHPVNAQRPNI